MNQGQHGIPMQQQAINVDRSQNQNSAQYGFQNVAPQQFIPNSAQYGNQNVNPQQLYQSSAPNKPGNSYQTASIHANPEN